jgi:hypothetical protein
MLVHTVHDPLLVLYHAFVCLGKKEEGMLGSVLTRPRGVRNRDPRARVERHSNGRNHHCSDYLTLSQIAPASSDELFFLWMKLVLTCLEQ